MRHLLEFLARHRHWFVFLLLEMAGFVLLFRFNHYQQSVLFTSAGAACGWIYRLSASVTSYFGLKTENELLLDRTLFLERRVHALEEALALRTDTAGAMEFLSEGRADTVIAAHVIKNSTARLDNYITLDRGAADGIRPDMGVVGPGGVVGIVCKTSRHYALVMSLLNSRSNLSCKIAGSGYFGYLVWDGVDSRFAYLKDLPRHAGSAPGDTVVTSGYSAVFPEGIMVGVVESVDDSRDGLSWLLKVRLSTDFGRLNNIRVISRGGQAEQRLLERFGTAEDGIGGS